MALPTLKTVLFITMLGLPLHGFGAQSLQEPILPITELPVSGPKVELGKALFENKKLSVNHDLACSSCHQPKHFYSQPFNEGIDTPSLMNIHYNDRFFWNGRAPNLKAAINLSLTEESMMGQTPENLVSSLQSEQELITSFNSNYDDGLNYNNVVDALSHFLSSLITPNASFDFFLKGNNSSISTDAKEGYELFKSYGCVSCHQGVNVGGNLMQGMGLYVLYFKDPKPYDFGLFAITKKPEDKMVFRVPSLRNVSKTAPYFHDGSAKTLKDAIHLMAKHQLFHDLTESEASKIEAFLNTLTVNEESPK